MTARSEIRIEGGPRQFAYLRQELEEAGVEVEGSYPMEQRSSTVETLSWIFVAIGIDHAVDAAIAKVKARWPGIRIGVRRADPED